MSEFRHYTDGDYEYQIERCEDNSGARSTGLADMRAWKLADRPVAPPRIVITGFCTHEPACVDDGSGRVHGFYRPPANPWQDAGAVYLPHAAGWDEAERRLLGADLLAECERTDEDAAATRRAEAQAPDAPVAVHVDLGLRKDS